jgi:hypothetical protein
MRRFHRICILSTTLLAATAWAGCKKPAPEPAPAPPAPAAEPAPPPAPPAPVPVSVTGVELGRQLGADKRVVQPTSTFAPPDTIYASVATDGSSESATLTARWTFETGQLVSEGSQTIAPTGPAVTEFHIVKPSGWPAGKYKVEIQLDGSPAGTQEFEVKK